MISCGQLCEIFRKNGFTFFCGVHDSTFKDWMGYMAYHDGEKLKNVIAVNECEATAICAGYHLGTGKIGVVYMQNSGLGKTVNPLTSLVDPDVYSIPAMLVIGWRGEPGRKDEPQHKKMGRVMLPLLDTLEIPYSILPQDPEGIEKEISKAKEYMKAQKAPYAIIIRKGIISEYEQKDDSSPTYEMTREDAIKTIVGNMDGSEVIISTTGKTSRELFEYREEKQQGHQNDFLTVGSMGCASSIALGAALEKPGRKFFVFDGDGATLMQMGALATIGSQGPKNYYHIIFDNEAHDSTGGQPTVSPNVRFEKVALACGYKEASVVDNKNDLMKALTKIQSSQGPVMLIVKVRKGARKDLGRPKTTPIQNKEALMKFLNG